MAEFILGFLPLLAKGGLNKKQPLQAQRQAPSFLKEGWGDLMKQILSFNAFGFPVTVNWQP